MNPHKPEVERLNALRAALKTRRPEVAAVIGDLLELCDAAEKLTAEIDLVGQAYVNGSISLAVSDRNKAVLQDALIEVLCAVRDHKAALDAMLTLTPGQA
jgi:UDP-N-acetylmuramyl pentapeptide synthase